VVRGMHGVGKESGTRVLLLLLLRVEGYYDYYQSIPATRDTRSLSRKSPFGLIMVSTVSFGSHFGLALRQDIV
jgi:hypothetical protein